MWVLRLQSPCIMLVKARVVTVLCRDRISQDYGAAKESESSRPKCLFPGQGQLFHTVSSASTSSSASVSVECGGWGECAGSRAAESTMIAVCASQSEVRQFLSSRSKEKKKKKKKMMMMMMMTMTMIAKEASAVVCWEARACWCS
jgi:hypothetical protein